MLFVGRRTTHTCAGLNRRAFLQVGASSVLGLSLADLLRVRGARQGIHPFFVVGGKLHQGKKAIIGEGGGPLGAAWDPFRLEYDPSTGTKIPALQLPAELTPERMVDRQKLLGALGNADRRVSELGSTNTQDAYRGRAL